MKSLEKQVSHYLLKLNIPISEKFVNKQILSHPDYPSILAVSDTLNQLGIQHTVARADKKNLNEKHFPALFHLDTAGGSLLPIYKLGDIDGLADKLISWSGVLLKADTTNTISNSENKYELKEERQFKNASIAFIAAAVVLIFVMHMQALSWPNLLVLGISILGLLTGYLLCAKELGITYEAVERFCGTKKDAGCAKVLRSDKGKLLGFVPLSDLTLAYFATQIVTIGLFAATWSGYNMLSVIGWISILVLPITVYSIWQQAVIIKEWCRLCLIVNAQLISQAIIFGLLFYSGLLNPFLTSVSGWLIFLMFFGLAVASIFMVKKLIQQRNKAVQNEINVARFKNTPEVFMSILSKQRHVDMTPFDHDFLIGKPHTPINLTLAVNLFCGPCKIEMEEAKALLDIYQNEVCLSLRILKSSDNGISSGLLLSRWLHVTNGYNRLYRSELGLRLLEDWYKMMDTESFANLHTVDFELSDSASEKYQKLHYNWIEKAGIIKTPAIFLNGYELPPGYQVKDLFQLIPGLVDYIHN